jgi:hypothetical protein
MPKALFTRQPNYGIGLTMINIIKNIKTFSDKVKIIFEVKGYVAKSNIVANVALKKVDLLFKG